ncbi:amidohydrolase [Oscillospiraceae bacterium MB08-C2-2]|nr:amidohydrolase [Oscillospiraceae bacterium MB08-C2-2]
MIFRNISYVDDRFEVVTDSNIAVEGSKVAWIGQNLAEYTGPKAEVVEGGGKLLLPGFYNNHCHAAMTLLRGYGEGLPLDRWLNERMFPFEDQMTGKDMYWGTLLGIIEMLKSGIVSFTDMYMIMEHIGPAVEESGIKANLSHGCSSFDDSKGYKDLKAYPSTLWLLDYVKGLGHDRIICDASLHAEYTATPRLVREVAEFAREHNLHVHTHISETFSEHEGCKERHGGLTPTQYLNSLGLFDQPTSAAHCVAVDEKDMEILKAKGVTVTHCPSSNLKLGSGVAPAWKMHQMGINVAIGTDGAASNNNLNGLEEVNLAAMVQRGYHREPMAMDMASTLRMACLNGAAAQGRADCGSIKVGNRADLVLYDLEVPHLQPVFDPLSNVLFSAQSSDIAMTMVDGKVLYKNGELTTIDQEKVLFECKSIPPVILAKLAANQK